MATLLSLSLLANLISFPMLGNFGRFSLVYLFAYLSGIILGPFAGFAVTFLGDLMPAMIFPQGPWLPLLTVSVASISLVVGVCFRYLPLCNDFKIAIGVALSFAICTLMLTPLAETEIFFMYPYTTAKAIGASLGLTSPYLMLMLSKLMSQPIMIVLNVTLLLPLLKTYQKLRPNSIKVVAMPHKRQFATNFLSRNFENVQL